MASWINRNYKQNNFDAIQFLYSKVNIYEYFHNELRQPKSLETLPSCRKCSFYQILNWRSFHSRSAFFLTGFLICSSHLPLPKNLNRPGSTLGQHFPIFLFLPPRFLAHETSGSKPCDLWCVMNWSYSPKTTQW